MSEKREILISPNLYVTNSIDILTENLGFTTKDSSMKVFASDLNSDCQSGIGNQNQKIFTHLELGQTTSKLQ